MPNNSSTGGPLQPTSSPLEGLALLNFLQGWLVGILNIDGTLVRPRWQPEPANIPDAGVAWMAFGIAGQRKTDTYPFVGFTDNADPPTYQLIRQEEFDILCSFYDLGSTGQADSLGALLRDGTAIPQNRELLRSNGFSFVGCSDLTPVPSLLKSRWLYRSDLTLTLRRQIDRPYPVLPVLEGDATIYANDGVKTLTRPIVSK